MIIVFLLDTTKIIFYCYLHYYYYCMEGISQKIWLFVVIRGQNLCEMQLAVQKMLSESSLCQDDI